MFLTKVQISELRARIAEYWGDHGTPIGQLFARGELTDLLDTAEAAHATEPKPIPMFLTCPMCGTRHIDEGEFATKPHHTHACQGPKCGLVWRPAIVHTVGVQHLPGFKNGPP